MTAVKIGPAILTLLDTGEQLAAYTADWSEQTERAGSVRVMANGRRRIVSRAGSARTLQWTFRAISAAQVATLAAWSGRMVMVRDFTGRKEFGVYFATDVTDRRNRPDEHDVRLTLQSASFSEAV